jgi:hypothetical protein
MSIAIYIALAVAVLGSLVWIVAMALFPVEIIEDEEPHGDASMLGRDRE